MGNTEDEKERANEIEVLQEAGETQKRNAELAGREETDCLECGHVFHATCIIRWAGRQIRERGIARCPVCRVEIPKERANALNKEYLQYGGKDDEYPVSEEDDAPMVDDEMPDNFGSDDEGVEEEPRMVFREESSEPQAPYLELSNEFESIFQKLEEDLERISPPEQVAMDLQNLAFSLRFSTFFKFFNDAQAPDELEFELIQSLGTQVDGMRVLTNLDANGNAYIPNLVAEANVRVQLAREAFQKFFRDIVAQWLAMGARLEDDFDLFDPSLYTVLSGQSLAQ